jgi:hypothetical protein
MNTLTWSRTTADRSSACDPSACDPSACDPSACDPSACDPSACDPSACDAGTISPMRRIRRSRGLSFLGAVQGSRPPHVSPLSLTPGTRSSARNSQGRPCAGGLGDGVRPSRACLSAGGSGCSAAGHSVVSTWRSSAGCVVWCRPRNAVRRCRYRRSAPTAWSWLRRELWRRTRWNGSPGPGCIPGGRRRPAGSSRHR